MEVYGFTFQVIGSMVPQGFPHYQRVEVQMASPRFSGAVCCLNRSLFRRRVDISAHRTWKARVFAGDNETWRRVGMSMRSPDHLNRLAPEKRAGVDDHDHAFEQTLARFGVGPPGRQRDLVCASQRSLSVYCRSSRPPVSKVSRLNVPSSPVTCSTNHRQSQKSFDWGAGSSPMPRHLNGLSPRFNSLSAGSATMICTCCGRSRI